MRMKSTYLSRLQDNTTAEEARKSGEDSFRIEAVVVLAVEALSA
jgi:hypothetical protein